MACGLWGCGDITATRSADRDDGELPSPVARLARVHVVAQSQSDELEGEPRLQVEARFVEYRGLDESFVRARASLLPLAVDIVAPGMCFASEDLQPDEHSDAKGATDRELSLVDVGDMWISIADRERAVPLALVPDFLEYVSGVEYFYADDGGYEIPRQPDGRTPVTLRVEGAADDDLPPFVVATHLPPVVDAVAETSPGLLSLRWEAQRRGLLQVEIHAYRDEEPVGKQLTCVEADDGETAFQLLELDRLGLGRGDYSRVTLRRFHRSTVPAGVFAHVEITTEFRAHVTAVSPRLHRR